MADIIKSDNNVPRRNVNMNDGTYAKVVSAVPNSIVAQIRESFENFNPNVIGSAWSVQNSGNYDIINVEGNTAGASYLSISRDPFSNDTTNDVYVETTQSFKMPMDVSFGLHSSQRTVGQDFYAEIVDTDTTLPAYTAKAISSISQATTTLTVTTTVAHGLSIGQRVTIYGVSDSRLNYPSLVVATTPTSTQFTVTAGPMGTIPSLTIGPFANGFVLAKASLGRSKNGTGLCLESSTATSGSFFIKSNSGEVFPSGTIAGNQTTTIATTASNQIVNSAGAYAMSPTSEQRLTIQSERVQWSDVAIDATSSSTSRFMRVQIIPNPEKSYKFRFRFGANKSLSKPVGGGILSATKAGSTTATIVTKQPHGLTVSDFITVYGILDQTNFANQTTAVQVASVIDSVTFTVVFGASATATSFGGSIVIVYGGNLPSALGYASQSITNAEMSSGILTLTGSTNWSGLSIGDIADVIGADTASGISKGIDGAWRVRNVATNLLTLEWFTSATPPSDFASVACSGSVVKRTSMRVSFVRIFDYERNRVEIMPRPGLDVSASVPVAITNTATVGISTSANSVSGVAAHDAVISGNPNRIAGRAVTANYTAVASGDVADLVTTTVGAIISKPYAIPEAGFNSSLALTTTTAAAIQTAAGAGLKRHITALQAINTGSSAVDLIILDGSTERWRLTLPVNVPFTCEFPTEIATTANTALNANLSASGTVRANFQGYTAP